MLRIKKSENRGYNKISWLESFHSFSFGNYYDENNVNYSKLRVINEDFVESHMGFGFHPHKNMEIITFMLDGNITHEDNLGNKGTLKSGKAQLMRAGTGIVHSEMNHGDDTAHLLQIWIFSDENNLQPGWWEKEFNQNNDIEIIVEPIIKKNSIIQLNQNISGNGLKMAQNGYILSVKKEVELDFSQFGSSEVYIHQAIGNAIINVTEEQLLTTGDAAMGDIDSNLFIKPDNNSTTLVFIFPK